MTAARWMVRAFCAAVCLAAMAVAWRGVGQRGIEAALFATGRLNFLLFWLSYSGGALTSLFGDRFVWLRRHAREFGLAFASALLVHLGLVAWLCAIGAAPAISVFAFFGIAVLFIYLMALASIARVRRALDPRIIWLLRTVGMHYVAYSFAADFLRNPFAMEGLRVLTYLPFAVLAVAGPVLRLAAYVWRVGAPRRASLYRHG